MSIDAMKLALEALENNLQVMKADWEQIDQEWGPSQGGLQAAIDGTLTGYEYFKETISAITALRERLAQPEHDDPIGDAQDKLIAEQAQNPETELETYKRLYELRGKALERPCSNCGHQPAKIKAMAQTEQEPVAVPVAFITNGGKGELWWSRSVDENGNTNMGDIPLYTAPPRREWVGLTAERPEQPIECMCGICKLGQRQWQGLTDDEIAEVRHLYDGTAGWTIERFARAIEAKLKEKNND